MTHGPPWVRRIALAAGLVSLAAVAAALLCQDAPGAAPTLDGPDSLLAAREFAVAERRIGEYLRANPRSMTGHMLRAQMALARDD